MYTATAFGLGWYSDVPLRLFQPAADSVTAEKADITVRLVRELPRRGEVLWHGKTIGFADGLRYRSEDGTAMDVIGADRIAITPGPQWSGELPVHFFSTIAAVALALRGLVPLHGSTLEISGRAVLLCGQAGAGKSTLAANLIALGARLISDDLSVLVPGENPTMRAGRPGIRLHPDTAAWLSAEGLVESFLPSYDGKVIACPPRVPPHSVYRLERVVLLDRQDTELPPFLAEAALRTHMFRPRLLCRLAGQETRLAALAGVVRKIAMSRALELAPYNPATARERAIRIWEMIAAG